MRFPNTIVVAALCSALSGPLAQSKPKEHVADMSGTVLLHSPESVDALTMSCEPKDLADTSLSRVRCEFDQVIITKNEKPSPEKIQERKEAFRKDLALPGKLEKYLATCKDSAQFLDTQKTLTSNVYKLAYIDKDRDALNAVCACKNAECVVSAQIDTDINRSSKACRITHTHFTENLTRQSPNRWVGVDGPTGLCKVVRTTIVDYDPTQDAWAYTVNRVVTSPESTCQRLTPVVHAYSHYRYPQNAVLSCETVESIVP